MKRFIGPVTMADPQVSDAEHELFGGPLRYDMGWSQHEHATLDLTMMSALRSMPTLVGATLRMAWQADRRALLSVGVSEIGQGIAAAAGLLAVHAVMHALLAGNGSAAERLHALLPGLLAAATIGVINSIDPAVTDRATRFLTQTGYGRIRVVTADAEHLPAEVVPDGGFDAIVVTVDTWDLPWIDALAEGGRLVAPVRLHGYHSGPSASPSATGPCTATSRSSSAALSPCRATAPGTGIAAPSQAPASTCPGKTAPRCPSTNSPQPSPASRP
ncbi:hypothetical protein [Streptomyces sp. NPDC001315]|uniref:hypothetical protein n=1 Tax=Streptomyces sp. NPDC001315 TaxID=3364562 RepID=UPI0036A6C484